MRGDLGGLVLQEVVRGVADGGLRDVDLVVGRPVHEDEVGPVLVEVLHVAAVDVGGLDLEAGVERLVDDLAGQDVLELGPHEGRALAGLDVLELHDGPQLALEVEDQAVLQVVGRCHVCSLAVQETAGMPRAEQRAAVSGRVRVGIAGQSSRGPRLPESLAGRRWHRRPRVGA